MLAKLAILDYLASGRFAEAIAVALGSDAVFFCTSEYVKKFSQTLERMKRAGLEIVVDNYGRAVTYQYFLADSANRLNLNPNNELGKKILKLDERGAKFVYYTHHSGFSIADTLFGANDFILCPSEAFLTSSVGGGKYILGTDRSPIMGKTKKSTEAVVVGMPNISDETLALAGEDKKEIQAQLAARLGLTLNPDLPLVFFLVDFRLEKGEMENICRVLSQNYNVVIKNQGVANPATGAVALDITGPNIFYFEAPPGEEDSELFYQFRMAADFTFHSFISGGLVTSLMMGIRCVSYHSTTIVRDMPPKRYNWTYFLRDFGWLTIQLAYWLAPLSLAAPELIQRRLGDAAYWERYDRDIKIVQQHTVGEYYLGSKASERAAFFIRRLLRVGSFAPSELPMGGGMINGPLFRSPCPVAL